MLQTKFKGHRFIGSGEDFKASTVYMGVAAIFLMRPRPFEQLFVPPTPGGFWGNLVTTGKWFRRRICLKVRTDDDG